MLPMLRDVEPSVRCLRHPTFLAGTLRSNYATEPSGWTGTLSFAQSLERAWLTAARKIMAPHGASIARFLRRTPNRAAHSDARKARQLFSARQSRAGGRERYAASF